MTDLSAWWKNALLGLIQGVTEFLPVSSSGHLLAAKEILGVDAGLALDVALHLATLAAVLIYFRRDLLAILRHSHRNRIILLLALATIPGAGLGKLLESWRDDPDPWWVVGGWCFSFAYLTLSKGRGGDRVYAELPFWRGVLVGAAQALAIFPGVSRAGSSIASGLWLGLEREQAFRFSFLLSIPLILGVGLYKAMKLQAEHLERMGGAGPLLVGMAVAFVVGMASIHVLLGVVRGNRFHRFGWYNLAVAGAFALYLIMKG